MRRPLPGGLQRIRLSTLALAAAFVGLFTLWVMVRAPSAGHYDGFTPLGAAASAAHLHFHLAPTPSATPTSPVTGGAGPAPSGHAPGGGS
ncbi:MAG TPA: hypothetical protein VHU88_05790 [Sporichthyaceae bacterium]|nr:hypothetical protein [Sporichthyaceae bacterium]